MHSEQQFFFLFFQQQQREFTFKHVPLLYVRIQQQQKAAQRIALNQRDIKQRNPPLVEPCSVRSFNF